MPTTTKMGIVYPSSTDLVKDGATAMGTISTTVDSKTGLVFLSTTTFTSQSTVSLPANTFTSSFTNYRIIYLAEVNSLGNLLVRLRAAGSDNTTSNYSYQNIQAASATLTAGRGTGQTSWEIVYQQSYDVPVIIDLFRPQATAKTLFLSQNMKDPYNQGSAMALGVSSGGFNATTSFDSASFIPSAGQITGTVSVYGYNV